MNEKFSDKVWHYIQSELQLGDNVMSKKWRTILLLALAELLAMGLWFSASAVIPALTTLASIRLIPLLAEWVGWQWSFTILALGPLLGIWAMWSLKQSPAALKLAGGRG